MQDLLLRHGAQLQKITSSAHSIKALENKVEALEKSLDKSPNLALAQNVSLILGLNLAAFALCQVFARQQHSKQFVCSAASMTTAVFLGTSAVFQCFK